MFCAADASVTCNDCLISCLRLLTVVFFFMWNRYQRYCDVRKNCFGVAVGHVSR